LPVISYVILAQFTTSMTGSFYAPNASFSANFDDSLFNFSGSIVVKNLILSRPFRFHFDESLVRRGPKRGFVVSSWQEL
jgi:hypothetical protein